jgi:hypothetical protein
VRVTLTPFMSASSTVAEPLLLVVAVAKTPDRGAGSTT